MIVKPHLRFEGVQHNAEDKSFTAMLTSLVSASRTKRNNAYTQISTDQVKTYQLSNSGLWFKSAVKSEAVHGWINESIEQGDDIYVVVGYHTMMNARIIEGVADSVDTSAWLKLPVGEALAIAGAGIPLGSVVDPAIGA